LAWLGADTTGVAEIPGGNWRVVDVVVRDFRAVVVVVLPVVVEVGAVVDVVDAGTVVVVGSLVGVDVTVEDVEVVEGMEEVGLSGVVRRVGFTTCGMVVDVVEVDVVVPLIVLAGVLGVWAPDEAVVEVVLGTELDGECATVVLVVDGLPVVAVVAVCCSAGTVVLVVVEDDEVVDVDVGVVVVVLLLLTGVVVLLVVVVTDDVGTVVVVPDVVVVAPVTPVVVVVVTAVVLVTLEGGGKKGVDNGAVSASAGPTAITRPRPVMNSAPHNDATSRASHLLEL
jgi:hypothetical protein